MLKSWKFVRTGQLDNLAYLKFLIQCNTELTQNKWWEYEEMKKIYSSGLPNLNDLL